MSDYIYGSSLRAAKSKANYLFEGDFRRRPNQNLAGASRSLARGELLQQAAEQRQNREDTRLRELASIKLQSLWRGYSCRRSLEAQMRNRFDDLVVRLNSSGNHCKVTEQEFSSVTKEFIIFYHSKRDGARFDILIDHILKNQITFKESMSCDTNSWLHKFRKLSIINLRPLKDVCASSGLRHLDFLYTFTRPGYILNDNQLNIIWRTLIENNIYCILRQLIDKSETQDAQSNDDLKMKLLELIRRSLDIEPTPSSASKMSPVMVFFNQFLKGPLSDDMNSIYFPKLIKMKPKCLTAQNVLVVFANCQSNFKSAVELWKMPLDSSILFSANTDHIKECTDTIWFCYSFIITMYTQIDQLNDVEKAEYLGIMSKLLVPAVYITNLSLMEAANNEDDDDFDAESDDELDSTSKNNRINQYHTEINSVISKLVNCINNIDHINGLKSIIFNNNSQQVQYAIIQICNLMLSHEPLAIFNCRLLYRIAFSREFTRSLWKSIISTTVDGTSTPVYSQLSAGLEVGIHSWNSILPRLRLFSSLYSYFLPTLDDEEFYTNNDIDNNDLRNEDGHQINNQVNAEQSQTLNKLGRTFFIDKELVGISAILRDICVGFIEILYKDNRSALHSYSTTYFSHNHHDEHGKLLSFEMKLCFKAIVRLICQLHARDSRKQFCPDGHWISPSVFIPANKAVDFQLLSKQKGRLIRQMTKEDKSSDKMTISSSEIKTVLILQEIPFVVSFYDRVQILHQLLRREKSIHQSHGYHFNEPGSAIVVQVRRNYIYEDAFEKLSPDNELNLKLPLKVSLINFAGSVEAGVDGGGLTKEFLSELLKAGFNPMRGFFKSTNDQLLYPNPSANVLFSNLPEGYAVHYEFLGKILGKAIFEKVMVELPLASFFLAKLLARRHSSDVDLHNLASLDPVLYKNLVYLKNYQGDVADLNLDFTISNNELDEHEVVELKPGGADIMVTRDNKIQYVHMVADYRLNKQIRAQCAAFKRGISQLIDLDWLRMFDSRELQILISGAPTKIDTQDWQRNTLYANGYSNECDVIRIFWKVTNSLDESQKRKLLRFATSCSLPPLLGFKDLVPQFTIAPSEGARLPTASTCFNLLKLPACEDEETMRSKLLYAIESNSGFELS